MAKREVDGSLRCTVRDLKADVTHTHTVEGEGEPIPVGDDAVLDGVLQGQDAPLALGLITNIGVFLTHTNHHTLAEEWGCRFHHSAFRKL